MAPSISTIENTLMSLLDKGIHYLHIYTEKCSFNLSKKTKNILFHNNKFINIYFNNIYIKRYLLLKMLNKI